MNEAGIERVANPFYYEQLGYRRLAEAIINQACFDYWFVPATEEEQRSATDFFFSEDPESVETRKMWFYVAAYVLPDTESGVMSMLKKWKDMYPEISMRKRTRALGSMFRPKRRQVVEEKDGRNEARLEARSAGREENLLLFDL